VADHEGDAHEAGLLQAGRLSGLERLIAGTAHEINNPLTSVSGLASLLLMDADDAQTREDLEVISKETERAVMIVRNLRSFVGRGEPEQQPCDLNEAVSLVTTARGYELRARGIEPVLSLGSGLPAVLAAHEDLLHLVLRLVLDAEDSLHGRHSAADGAAAGDQYPSGVLLQLATFATGTDAVLASTYDAGRDQVWSEECAKICGAMARSLGGSRSVERLPDGRVRTVITLPGAS
jgi:nitrogen fixation/metabolism regulation signal transduction histidine kinase